MLSSKDNLESFFRKAYFDQQAANESSTDAKNVCKTSAKVLKSRLKPECLEHVNRQIELLEHHLTENPKDTIALELLDDKLREYAIALPGSNDYAVHDTRIRLHEFMSLFDVDDELIDEQVNDLNRKLETMLKPPKPKPISPVKNSSNSFVTAKALLGASATKCSVPMSNGGMRQSTMSTKSLGVNKRPRTTIPSSNKDLEEISTSLGCYNQRPVSKAPEPKAEEAVIDPRLAGIDPKLVEMIKNEIQHGVDNISWENIAGLEHAKNTIKEIVIWPMLRPDIFTGLRGPPKGLLLFGPPGTGKTLIGKCIASQAKATFFSISASSLTSKWVGEGEKLVRALFAVARCNQPAVIFIDEIDSLLTQRTDGEFEASRRIKTEFLVQFDGAGTSSEDRILIIGATNRPQEIDEAARRRLVKRLYIPLPDYPARLQIVQNLLGGQKHDLTDADLASVCNQADGYSGSDMDNLCREAALGPIRSIKDILMVTQDAVRPIRLDDFTKALTQVRASVSQTDLAGYLEWNRQFGSLS